MVSAPGPKYCFGFQRGACARGADCPFVHQKDPSVTEAKISSGANAKKPQARLSKEAVPKRGGNRQGNNKSGGRSRDRNRGASAEARNGSKSPSEAKMCFRCGSSKHMAPECKFDGECNYCKKSGHKESVCKKKKFEENRANVAEVQDDNQVVVRVATTYTAESPLTFWDQQWATEPQFSVPDPPPMVLEPLEALWDPQTQVEGPDDLHLQPISASVIDLQVQTLNDESMVSGSLSVESVTSSV